MKFRPNGAGVAFGKAAEHDNTFEIDSSWAVKSRGIIDLVYPVGSIYLSVGSTSPAALFGGTWQQIENRFLLGAGSDYTAGTTGGEAEHSLTIDEIPSHSHKWPSKYSTSIGAYIWYTPWTNNSGTIDAQVRAHTDAAGGGEAHNNMPPYLAVFVWKRVS